MRLPKKLDVLMARLRDNSASRLGRAELLWIPDITLPTHGTWRAIFQFAPGSRIYTMQGFPAHVPVQRLLRQIEARADLR